MADAIRQALAPYRDREQRPLARPDGALPVALITRLFPLLPTRRAKETRTDVEPMRPADATVPRSPWGTGALQEGRLADQRTVTLKTGEAVLPLTMRSWFLPLMPSLTPSE